MAHLSHGQLALFGELRRSGHRPRGRAALRDVRAQGHRNLRERRTQSSACLWHTWQPRAHRGRAAHFCRLRSLDGTRGPRAVGARTRRRGPHAARGVPCCALLCYVWSLSPPRMRLSLGAVLGRTFREGAPFRRRRAVAICISSRATSSSCRSKRPGRPMCRNARSRSMSRRIRVVHEAWSALFTRGRPTSND